MLLRRALVLALAAGALLPAGAQAAASQPSLIAFEDRTNGVFTVEPGNPGSVRFIYPSGYYPQWSPNATTLAVVDAGVSDHQTIKLLDRSGRVMQTLTHATGGVIAPAWSPDGTQLAYGCEVAPSVEPSQICIVDVATNQVRQLTHLTGEYAYSRLPFVRISWHPDASRLAFDVMHTIECDPPNPDYDCESMEIGVADAASGAFTPLTDDGATQPQYSPDGESLLYYDRDEGGGVMVGSDDGGGGHVVVPKEHAIDFHNSFYSQPAWSPDGASIVYQTACSTGRARVM